MSSMVPDAIASTTKHGGPLETHHDDQAPPSTLRRRVVSDPGPTIPAAGGTVEASGLGLQCRVLDVLTMSCRVLTAAHQGFNALSLSGGDWPVVAVVLFSLPFQS